MARLSPREAAARLAQRTAECDAILAAITGSGARGLSSLEVAQTMAMSVGRVAVRLLELQKSGAVEPGPRQKRMGLHTSRRYVEAGLQDMHRAWWSAWRAEERKVRIAALPKKTPKPKPPKPKAPPKPRKVALKTVLESAWSKGSFAHLRSRAGEKPVPFTRGVRSIFEVAA